MSTDGKITTQCPACKSTLAVGSQHAGKRIKCPKCGEIITVPILVSKTVPREASPPEISISSVTGRADSKDGLSNRSELVLMDHQVNSTAFLRRTLIVFGVAVAIVGSMALLVFLVVKSLHELRVNEYREACIVYFDDIRSIEDATLSKAKRIHAEWSLRKEKLKSKRESEDIARIGEVPFGSPARQALERRISNLKEEYEDSQVTSEFAPQIRIVMQEHERLVDNEMKSLQAIAKRLRIDDATSLSVREAIKNERQAERQAVERELQSFKSR